MQMMELWVAALDLTDDNALGIHLAEATPLDALGLHGYVMLSSPSLRQAYRGACRYQRLIHEVTDLTFDEESHTHAILQHALPGGRPVPRFRQNFLSHYGCAWGGSSLGQRGRHG